MLSSNNNQNILTCFLAKRKTLVFTVIKNFSYCLADISDVLNAPVIFPGVPWQIPYFMQV